MNAQLLISEEFLPPGTGSLSSGSETHFFPSLINFLLLLWQAPLHVSFGSASFSNSGSRRWSVGVNTGGREAARGRDQPGVNAPAFDHPARSTAATRGAAFLSPEERGDNLPLPTPTAPPPLGLNPIY